MTKSFGDNNDDEYKEPSAQPNIELWSAYCPISLAHEEKRNHAEDFRHRENNPNISKP